MADSTIRYPYRTFRYTVEIDGIARGGFSEVSGFDLNVDVVEYREGDDLRNTPRKLPGLTKYGNITFKWGVVGDMEMLDWLYTVASSDQAPPTGVERKNITVTLIDDTRRGRPAVDHHQRLAGPLLDPRSQRLRQRGRHRVDRGLPRGTH